MTQPFGVAIVGLGMAVKPHALALADLAEAVTVHHAWSPSPDRRAAFHAAYGLPVTERLETVLEDARVEAVLLLTPPDTHLDLVRRAIAAGKHVLLEKPLEADPARADLLVAECAAAGRTLGLVLQHRFRPSAERLRALLDGGALGTVVGAGAVIRLWRPQDYYDQPGRGRLARDGGGVLLTQGIHTLDLLLAMAGAVDQVAGFATTSAVHRMETEDLVAGAVRFASGALGTIDATTAAFPGQAEKIEIIGTHGTATLAGTALEVRWQDGRLEAMAADATPGGTGADPMAFPHDYHRALILDFVDAVRGGRPPRADGRAALAVHDLIAALLAAASSGKVVPVRRR
ncbi:putative dehydrogenase [Stella humosa]|uniref:Putative dehydrogenase n=1 Tax=Stella humosa TaxID=94 RepID=A0A3N1MCE9_9PROT|nr:Gfo/Idh/MocA family oxidoreductase [Stella humosa]ROQ01401.1 putative dehydrogenase [Stella humosa]BBK31777.1 oxidoreductase [Stella humosa]